MNRFNIKEFEKNKGKQGYYNEYEYKLDDGSNVREFEDKTNNLITYQREIRKDFSPFITVYNYYDDGSLRAALYEFNDSPVLYTEYDKLGRITKQTDYDKDYQHTFEQIREIVLKEKGIDIYDRKQAKAERHHVPDYYTSPKKYYQIFVLKSDFVDGHWFVQPVYGFFIDDSTGKEWQSPAQNEPLNDTQSINKPEDKEMATANFLEGESSGGHFLILIIVAISLLIAAGVAYYIYGGSCYLRLCPQPVPTGAGLVGWAMCVWQACAMQLLKLKSKNVYYV